MPQEPANKRTIAFIDGQNLYHTARQAFGYTYPNYDVQKLARAISTQKGWDLKRVHFYTGVPDPTDNVFWHGFWRNKLAMMGRRGVRVYSRALIYRNKTVPLPDGTTHTFLAGEEKGIDVRLALEVLDLAHRNEYDVALIFSQDQDLSELADLIRAVVGYQNRWIKIASAYPDSPTRTYRRGIDRTDWCPVDRTMYDACIDPLDYRPSP